MEKLKKLELQTEFVDALSMTWRSSDGTVRSSGEATFYLDETCQVKVKDHPQAGLMVTIKTAQDDGKTRLDLAKAFRNAAETLEQTLEL